MTIDTPCIGLCSTVYGDDICRGCQRTFQEVIDWNGLGLLERQMIWDRLNSQAQEDLNNLKSFKNLSGQVRVIDEQKFAEALIKYHVIQTPKHSQAFLILLLLRQAAGEISDGSEIGLEINNLDFPLP